MILQELGRLDTWGSEHDQLPTVHGIHYFEGSSALSPEGIQSGGGWGRQLFQAMKNV